MIVPTLLTTYVIIDNIIYIAFSVYQFTIVKTNDTGALKTPVRIIGCCIFILL